jgi:hypothetical protein
MEGPPGLGSGPNAVTAFNGLLRQSDHSHLQGFHFAGQVLNRPNADATDAELLLNKN